MPLKVLRIAFLSLLVALAAAPAAFPAWAQDANRFVSVIDDLPLMEGLAEVGEGVEFTTPQGRIVEATATAAAGISRRAVLGFYAETLPQLGWTATGEGAFAREGERLELLFGRSAGALTVRFSLAPADK